MELSVLERLVILGGLLPEEGSVTTLRIVRKLQEDLGFSEDDHAAMRPRNEKDPASGQMMVKWDEVALDKDGQPDPERQAKIDALKVRDIPLGLKATNLIVEALQKLSKDKKLQSRHLSLYEKFIEAEDVE